ncbi:MAG: hypothetical protein AB1749_10185 [Pseudomonadota bacterium]
MVVTLEDCIAFCGLAEAEVLAIAEHEHIPEIAAAALAECLLAEPHGPERIAHMIRDDIRAALARGDRRHAREVLLALRHFLSEHPGTLCRDFRLRPAHPAR